MLVHDCFFLIEVIYFSPYLIDIHHPFTNIDWSMSGYSLQINEASNLFSDENHDKMAVVLVEYSEGTGK